MKSGRKVERIKGGYKKGERITGRISERGMDKMAEEGENESRKNRRREK